MSMRSSYFTGAITLSYLSGYFPMGATTPPIPPDPPTPPDYNEQFSDSGGDAARERRKRQMRQVTAFLDSFLRIT